MAAACFIAAAMTATGPDRRIALFVLSRVDARTNHIVIGAMVVGAMGFIEKQLQASITWAEWFVAGAPFSALLSIALYFIMTRMMKPEMKEIAGGRVNIRQQLDAIGPMATKEWKWGTVVLFAIGIIVGTALLRTNAAGRVANLIVQDPGLQQASAFAILMLLSLFLIVMHLGFASATALASITLAATVLLVIFALTYWSWMGYMIKAA